MSWALKKNVIHSSCGDVHVTTGHVKNELINLLWKLYVDWPVTIIKYWYRKKKDNLNCCQGFETEIEKWLQQ